ncbi:hypothetical protein J7F03_25925 [Streptomyces sp. ISL-43]|uniref:hypothetical protein n=1 Tax=Streptomyces sp. ISL-43 TaxID=2819183 RepID=UPI001BECC68E|nr:hypothetical protein [Streptomyces sp. ISL-43]MBT2450452.1 hypothetical protein [Streptomyces sp. ISL-43]
MAEKILKPELRKIFETAEAEERGFSSREIAAVINSIPAEERMARTEVLAAINGEHGSTSAETREAIASTLKAMEMRAADAREDRDRSDWESEVRALTERSGIAALPVPVTNTGRGTRTGLTPSNCSRSRSGYGP